MQSAPKMPECPICMDSYDSHRNQPRLFRRCGHSICEPCLRDLFRNNFALSINCPICRLDHEFRPLEEDSLDLFPRNFAILTLLENNTRAEQQTCPLHNEPISHFCFANECPLRGFLCRRCRHERHGRCPSAFVVRLSELSTKAAFDSSIKSLVENTKRYKRALLNDLDCIKDLVIKIFDSIAASQELFMCQVSLENPATLLDHLDWLETSHDTPSQVVRIGHFARHRVDFLKKSGFTYLNNFNEEC